MKSIVVAAALSAAAVLGTVAPSMAATGSIPLTNVSGTNTFTYYAFSTGTGAGTYKVTASSSSDASFTGTGINIYNRMTNALVQAGTNLGGDFARVPATLSAGMTYVLRFQTSGTGAFTGNITGAGIPAGSTLTQVAGVPLPNSVALFGVAVAAVGVAGALRRKGTAARAA